MTFTIENGVPSVSGVPAFMLCTDYPYFRDDPANWRDRLVRQREAGFPFVSAYVPWRHHAPTDPREGGEYDFDGRTKPSRDLQGFLDAAEEAELKVILKPGPFVHAELPYGGLPDYVCPARNPQIEPEAHADGTPLVWSLRDMPPSQRHALPAPFDETYLGYVREWLGRVVEDVIRPRQGKDGSIVGIQLMNEGIYSDSSSALPDQLGFASSTLAKFRRFIEDSYETIGVYNQTHGTGIEAWEEVQPPRRLQPLPDVRALLCYMDWSVFQSVLYVDAAKTYRQFLLDAGMDRAMPVIFNFNPNGNTYRTKPGSNDGWYTRVNAAGREGFTFGATNWLGVIANDFAAYRQYVMAYTLQRGPGMEQNWGFNALYQREFTSVTASHFESMVAAACGASGITAYTLAGTRAWRDDENLNGQWIPERTNTRRDQACADYPGAASIDSEGGLHGKYWTLRQMAQYFRSESSRFVAQGPRAGVAWGIYPRYACVGQWMPRGDTDEISWKPELVAVPHAAYHGLDAFVEMATGEGVAFAQVDFTKTAAAQLCRYKALCVSSYQFMGHDAQQTLVDYVRQGGRLLLTGLVPERDERLNPGRGPLRDQLFTHETRAVEGIETPRWMRVGELEGRAADFAVQVAPPADADLVVESAKGPIGYRRRVGEGSAVFLGTQPWRGVHSQDNPFLARRNHAFLWGLLSRVAGEDVAPASSPQNGVEVWQHGPADEDFQQLFVIVHEPHDEVEVAFTRASGARARLRLTSPPQAVHAISIENGRLRAAYLKGINDLAGVAVAPSVRFGDAAWEADEPCDVCITPERDGWLVTTAHALAEKVRVCMHSKGSGPLAVDVRPLPDEAYVAPELERH